MADLSVSVIDDLSMFQSSFHGGDKDKIMVELLSPGLVLLGEREPLEPLEHYGRQLKDLFGAAWRNHVGG